MHAKTFFNVHSSAPLSRSPQKFCKALKPGNSAALCPAASTNKFRANPRALWCTQTRSPGIIQKGGAAAPPCGRWGSLRGPFRPRKLHILRPAASGRAHPFRCSSSPNCDHFVGSQFGTPLTAFLYTAGGAFFPRGKERGAEPPPLQALQSKPYNPKGCKKTTGYRGEAP